MISTSNLGLKLKTPSHILYWLSQPGAFWNLSFNIKFRKTKPFFLIISFQIFLLKSVIVGGWKLTTKKVSPCPNLSNLWILSYLGKGCLQIQLNTILFHSYVEFKKQNKWTKGGSGKKERGKSRNRHLTIKNKPVVRGRGDEWNRWQELRSGLLVMNTRCCMELLSHYIATWN